MQKKLTAKQQRFVDEYLLDLNGTQAAIRAGYCASTASKQACKNLAMPAIAAAIVKGKRERSERTRVNADWLLSRLADEADADIADLYTEAGALKPVHEWPLIWRKGLVQGVDIERIFEGEGKARAQVGELVKVKLSDRAKRLELIGRHVSVGAFKDEAPALPGEIKIVINRPARQDAPAAGPDGTEPDPAPG